MSSVCCHQVDVTSGEEFDVRISISGKDMKKKMAKAHQLAPFAGRREVAGYENRRFYFVLNRHASALCSPEPQRGDCSILATLRPPN
jgi:hypothetical protein